ncbi:CXADR-like membrane protein isoform X2 [Gambusia affinis]|uniref:CXADR-like membrane protein isoform X2 n=1 Tax=Gambusia affinis TaxID=33528 RepID=UPI001CDCB07D|nr:CXADR-like membrane protein isoform X2 [Gambusia affinis]
MAHLYFQVCLLVFVVKVPPKCRGEEIVSAFPDEDVVLSCLNFNITDPRSCYRIRLVNNTDDRKPSVLFEYPKKSQDAKRVNLEANRKGQTCVFLKTLQKSDQGTYHFEIWKGWDKINVTLISLKVKDCRNLKPEVAKPGQNVNLNCSVDAETTPSNVTWARMKGSDSVPVNLTRVEMKGISLTIKSLSASDTGWYRCDYILGQSRRCSEIYLRFQDHQEAVSTTTMIPRSAFTEIRQVSPYSSSEPHKTEGRETSILVVVLTITLIFTLAALTGVLIYKRYKTQRKSAESADVYENVSLPCSPDTKDRINSLYALPEENVEGLTFQI